MAGCACLTGTQWVHASMQCLEGAHIQEARRRIKRRRAKALSESDGVGGQKWWSAEYARMPLALDFHCSCVSISEKLSSLNLVPAPRHNVKHEARWSHTASGVGPMISAGRRASQRGSRAIYYRRLYSSPSSRMSTDCKCQGPGGTCETEGKIVIACGDAGHAIGVSKRHKPGIAACCAEGTTRPARLIASAAAATRSIPRCPL